MVEPAPANADAQVPTQRQAERSKVIGVQEAVEITGLSTSTIQRRVKAWIDGDRTDYALKGGRAGAATRRGTGSNRYIDRADAEALAKQLRGELPPNRHANEPPADTSAGYVA